MKKKLFTVGLIAISLFFIIIKTPAVTAYATNNTINVVVKCITSDEASYYNSHMTPSNSTQCVAGDYAISLVISDNTGFAATGYRIKYDGSLGAPRTHLVGDVVKPIFCKGDVMNGSSVTCTASLNSSTNLLAIGTMGTDNENRSGVIITYFIQPFQQLTLNQEQQLIIGHEAERWTDYHNNPVPYTSTNGFTLYSYSAGTQYTSWIIGDIDHDGEVTVADAQLILGLYVDYNIGDSSTIFTTEYIGTFILDNNDEVDKLYVVSVCDVNEDGVIDVEDANDVLSYYITYVTGQGNLNNYTGIIGTSTGLYTEYSVTFS